MATLDVAAAVPYRFSVVLRRAEAHAGPGDSRNSLIRSLEELCRCPIRRATAIEVINDLSRHLPSST
jgi:hypothetical protein